MPGSLCVSVSAAFILSVRNAWQETSEGRASLLPIAMVKGPVPHGRKAGTAGVSSPCPWSQEA